MRETEEQIKAEERQTKLDLLSRPVTTNLNVVLQKCGIKVQAYHSLIFIGNHHDKYQKPDVYKVICDRVVNKTKELSKTNIVINKAIDSLTH